MVASAAEGIVALCGWKSDAAQYIQCWKIIGWGRFSIVTSAAGSDPDNQRPTARPAPLAGLSANEKLVLRVMRREGEVHRSRISQLTGLPLSTLTALCDSLISRGLADEKSAKPSGKRGKPRKLLNISPKGGFAAGLSLSAERLRVCLSDLCGKPQWECEVRLWDLSPAAVTQEARQALDEGLAQLDWPLERFLGAGLCMPGHVERGSHIPVPLPQFGSWRGQHPGELMARALGTSVIYENDASTAALAELLFGVGRSRRSFLCIYCAHGVGGGLVINGQLHRGANGNAGEIGAFFPRTLSRPSGDDLLAHLARSGHPATRIDEIALTDATRQSIEAWADRAGAQLLEIIKAATYLLDLEAVFVSGVIPVSVGELLVERLALSDARLHDRHPWPDIELGTFCGQGPHRGAAALPIDVALTLGEGSHLGF
ncbi:MAG: hypothetical protein B7Y88_00365 [Sphingomonadales bacterium 32-64-17]|nr:MAG: hypothetical protein B7Y88_00365 [Sphingomonadales bacterium 32-64-17]